jgi:S-formylglutathione hydrolase FrmB
LAPTSPFLLALLILGAVGSIGYAIFRLRQWWTRIAAAALGVVLAMTSGVAIVNDFYGYYQTWSALGVDFLGRTPELGRTAPAHRSAAVVETGGVQQLTLSGTVSQISRVGYVYLPPQYYLPAYRAVRFPVLELLHGTPGTPANWLIQLQVPQLMDKLIAAHEMGPMVLVMPAINPLTNGHWQECTDGPRGLDDTYLSTDVPTIIRARYRVSTDPAEWGLLGYSSGGYCAANLALRHRAKFGAAAVLDGYFRAKDGPAGAALGGKPALEDANSPLTIARSLRPDTAPMPAFWVSVGTGDRTSLAFDKAFVSALERTVKVTSILQPGGRHDFYTFAHELPPALIWSWPQLAAPGLQRAFPLTASPPMINLAPVQEPRTRVAAKCPTASSHPKAAKRATTPPARLTTACS